MTFEDGKKAIARIYSAPNQVVGVGFLVADRYVLTCAHVVNACGVPQDNPIGSTLSLAFPFSTGEQLYTAEVIGHELQGDCGSDYAVLRLDTVLAIPPIDLETFIRTESPVGLQAFGFPKGDQAGRNLIAESRGTIAPGDWEQIEDTKQPGLAVEEGFSGAPVWCPSVSTFVGMIVARDKRREAAKVGFMIPTQKLNKPLKLIQKRTLLDLLEPEQNSLTEQIQIAYEVCRREGTTQSYKAELSARLDDLAGMADGEIEEPMLVQFAACLLNQSGLSDNVRTQLEQWAQRYTQNLNTLRTKLQDQQNQKLNHQSIKSKHPGLLISVKAHESQEKHYTVNAWFIRDFNQYDATTGQGSEALTFQNLRQTPEDENLDPETGIPDRQLPSLFADYLDQVGARVDLQALTIELLLPMVLMNQRIEQQPIPCDFGLPEALVASCRVSLRSQDRLESPRFLGTWAAKWQQLETSLSLQTGPAFVTGSENLKQMQRELKPNEKLGLLLPYPPSADEKELGVLIGTGTPIALWVRKDHPNQAWGHQFCQQILGCLGETCEAQGQSSCCLHQPCSSDNLPGNCRSILLGKLLDRVTTIRREALERDDDLENIAQSLELGHHLAFVWENPKRVPPTSKSPYQHPSSQ
ncbi:MAG: hypothetical protein B0A82_07555 [Alkalinema sp. CACIAM 70d]|nr:MAG: hypothetical protein B0A82_07555 [Alkalinema sp. CACIAM 70d]